MDYGLWPMAYGPSSGSWVNFAGPKDGMFGPEKVIQLKGYYFQFYPGQFSWEPLFISPPIFKRAFF